MKFLIGYILITNIWIVLNALNNRFRHKESIPRYLVTLVIGIPIYTLYKIILFIMAFAVVKMKYYNAKNQILRSRAKELSQKENVDNEDLYELQHSAVAILLKTKLASKIIKLNAKFCSELNFIIRSALLY